VKEAFDDGRDGFFVPLRGTKRVGFLERECYIGCEPSGGHQEQAFDALSVS